MQSSTGDWCVRLNQKGTAWRQEFGSFPKEVDPNIHPKILWPLALISGTPKKVPLILGNSCLP